MKREIMAKTMMGKGKLSIIETKRLTLPEVISKTLGCWIINHSYEAEERNRAIAIQGKYDIQLWYALDNDQKTNVYYETIPFSGSFIMTWRKLNAISDDMHLKVRAIKYPTAINMELVDEKTVELRIESEYLVDVFQEAILYIETLEQENDDEILDEEITMNVNPNYLSAKKE